MSDLVPATTQVPRTLVALSPGDMPAQQAQLSAWIDQRIREFSEERSDATDNARLAAEKGWATSRWEAAAKRAEARLNYYQKIRVAVDAGYLILPNLDMHVLAVRVHRGPGSRQAQDASAIADVHPDRNAPPGTGIYVGPRHELRDGTWQEAAPNPKWQGQTITKGVHTVTGFRDVDFPLQAVKPILMDATQHAMALKVFDEIGVVTGEGQNRRSFERRTRREDPVIVGRIIDPRTHLRWGSRQGLTFFIAWWLDVRTV